MGLKKISVVTGTLAAEIVKSQVKTFSEVVVKVLPVSVAAFISPKLLLERQQQLVGSDLVIVPGMAYGDFSKVSQALNMEVVKGPRYAFDLPMVLDYLFSEKATLSPKVAADLLLEDVRKAAVEQFYDAISSKIQEPTEFCFYLGTGDTQTPVGVGYPPLVVGEITDALLLPLKKVVTRAKRFVDVGVQIVDIGALVGEEHPVQIEAIVAAVRECIEPLNALVSIDSLAPSEIEAGVAGGAELVFSIDSRNMKAVLPSCKGVGVVVLPTSPRSLNPPRDAKSRTLQLNQNIAEARHLGYKKIIGDLILESMVYPGLLNSLAAYSEFRRTHPLVPLCMGTGNVTEFADFDSVGINGVLASLGIELDVNLFLTTEASIKTRNTGFELVRGIKMAFFAKHRNMPPKDLGVDLLISKSKRRKTINEPVNTQMKPIDVEQDHPPVKRDKKGYFRIYVDYDEKTILVEYFTINGQLKLRFKGKNARNLYLTILERGLVGDCNHASYLGSELKKAEICLRLGKEFYQDEDPFVG